MKQRLAFFKKQLLWLAVNAACLGLFWLFRTDRTAMDFVAQRITAPYRDAVGRLCHALPISVSELLYAAAILGALAYLIRSCLRVRRAPRRGAEAARRALGLANAALTVYVLFCLLWGANYYATGFCEEAGLTDEPITVAALSETTSRFAAQLSACAGDVVRDDEGVFAVPRADLLAASTEVYSALSLHYPQLAMDDRRPKAMLFSRIMSAMGFTGFYFPFTGESNVNVDSPSAWLPCTIAHELAHQRGYASEQECNLLGILACVTCGDAAYRYSGYLSGYVHLSNALYRADYDAWLAVYQTLPETVLADLRAQSAYWAQFEGPVEQAGTKVYDAFLKSYGEERGVQSYGAVVDLLVQWDHSGQSGFADAAA